MATPKGSTPIDPTDIVPAAIDKFALVTANLVQLLEQGTLPWRQPWHSKDAPRNLITGHVYRGINPMLCQIDCLINRWERPLFVSFAQAREQGWTIRKGAKSTWIKWGGSGTKTTEREDGSTAKQVYSTAKWHNVFHVSWIDDAKSSERKVSDFLVPQAQTLLTDSQKVEAIEHFIDRQQATVNFGGNKAFYLPVVDAMQMPHRDTFETLEHFYATHIHELGHWTGHESRLGRDLAGEFESVAYAREELVAELSSAFVCNELSINVQLEHHASYLQHWLTLLRGDDQAFFKAASQAQKAADWLLAKAGMSQGEDETDV